jgi:signal recognition particle-docking protein FtsY
VEIVVPLVLVLLVLVGVFVLLNTRRRKVQQGLEPPQDAGSAEVGRQSARETAAPAPAPAGFKGEGLAARIRSVFGGGDTDEWKALEDVLLKADVGPKATADLVGRVRARFGAGDDPVALVRDEILAILGPDTAIRLPPDKLGVLVIVGVNGAGKTTSIGKLARMLADAGHDVSLAASDTFRAAAGDQLDVWAQRSGAHIVSQDRGADPGAVAFDAVTSAIARGSDVLLVDTAGRLHTKTPLMDELKKIRRTIEKAGGEVDETLLVLDANTGQNGIAQAAAFTEAVDVTGVILTKMDGSARGGFVLAVREQLGVPVRYVGVGEGIDDLRPFAAEAFTDRLLADR